MPFMWRRIAWFASFGIAVLLAMWMRNAGYGWPTALGTSVVIWVLLPFVISQACAAFVLTRAHLWKRHARGLVDRIADATKELPPDQQDQ